MPSETATSPAFIVTGASRGIGEAIVRELMRRGARVLGVAGNPDAAAGGYLRKLPLPAWGCDCRSRPYLDGFEAARRMFGWIDGVINNAGRADGYGAYDDIGGAKVIRAGCWSHARRKFFQALQVDPQEKRALELVATIDELFSIEARARQGRFDVQQRLALRQAEAGPWLEKIKTLALEARKAALPRSRLAEGCDYVLKRWKLLTCFLQHESLEISTNLAENAIRPIALSRNYEQSGIRQSLTRTKRDFRRLGIG